MLAPTVRFLFLTLALSIAACASALASEYYSVGPSEAIYIAWTQDSSGHLQGQVEVVDMETAGSTQLKTTNSSFTGTRSGSDVSLAFGTFSAFSGATWTGHIGWSTLTLVIPTSGVPQRVTLSSGSFDQFQAAVMKMQGHVAKNQTNVRLYNAVTEAANLVKDGSALINNGLQTLQTMFPETPSDHGLTAEYKSEWQTMQETWAKEQAAGEVVPMTCYQKGQVSYVAGQVAYVLGQFHYLDGQAQNLANHYKGAVGQVKQGMTELETWSPEFDVRARNYAKTTGGSYSGSITPHFRQIIVDAQISLGTYANRWNWFVATIQDYDQRAQQQNDEAKSYAEGLSCG